MKKLWRQSMMREKMAAIDDERKNNYDNKNE
jgi:hypothetical protein